MHGQMGENSMRPGGVMRISATQVQFGVTSFCPASVTDSDENTRIFLENVRQAMTYRKGARVLGAYLEGPYLDHDLRGVHDDRYIKDPSISHYCALVDGYEDIIVRVTLAPEKDGGMELVQYLTDQGITVSIGHSAASADETRKAIRLGINTTTHTFNAMRPLHHRQPGVLGVALTHPGISTEFIADMVHINPLIVKLIYLAKGGKMFLLHGFYGGRWHAGLRLSTRYQRDISRKRHRSKRRSACRKHAHDGSRSSSAC